MASATPEQAQAGMEAWTGWAEKAGDTIVDFGSPVTSAGSVGASSADSASGFLGGFSILQADTADDLKKQLEDHPHLMVEGNSIEVCEFLAIPGME